MKLQIGLFFSLYVPHSAQRLSSLLQPVFNNYVWLFPSLEEKNST